MRKCSILGCGWLGLPLAKSLLGKGFGISGSTTSQNKLPVLEKAGINPFLISLSIHGIAGNIREFLHGSDTLIIDIPPRAKEDPASFPPKIKALIPFIEEAGIKMVLFVSSISIYAEKGLVVMEETVPEPDSPSGTALLQAEALLQKNNLFSTTIIRFGGLIGNDRHPVYHLSGKINLINPDNPVNLIHLNDCIGIIEKILEKDIWGETFNAAAPFHPSRKEYYSRKALELNLPIPEFSNENISAGKTIDSEKITRMLGYNFTVSA
ncbi:MAG TPA: NAD(P)H-binding protein [Flavobacterium sp.]|jgi:hypothetical protein